MKKMLQVTLTLLIASITLFSHHFVPYFRWNQFNNSFNRIYIEVSNFVNDESQIEKFFNEIDDFSIKYDINVLQIHQRTENDVSIFSTLGTDSVELMWDDVIETRVFDLSTVYDTYGIFGYFRISGGLDEVELFRDYFSSYGRIVVQENFDNDVLLTLAMMNSIYLFSFLILLIINLFVNSIYCQWNRKRLFLTILWGKSQNEATLTLNKEWWYSYGKVCTVFIAITYIVAMFNDTLSLYFNQLPITLMLQMTGLIFFTIIFIINNLVIYKINPLTESLKGKRSSLGILFVSLATNFLLTILILFLLLSATQDYFVLRTELANSDRFEQAYHVFNLGFNFDAGLMHRQPTSEHAMDLRRVEFYRQLADEFRGFIIETSAFNRFSPTCLKEEFYFFGCEVIFADFNYLKRHDIFTHSGVNVLHEISNNQNVLNLLVPMMYQTYEERMIEYHFEFLNHERTQHALEQDKTLNPDDLEINIIYIHDNQSFFTYNFRAGDFNNNVINPIVVIISNGWSAGTLSVMMDTSLFMVDETNLGLESILDLRTKSGVSDLRVVHSVYSMGTNFLNEERARFISQIVLLIPLLIVTISLKILATWLVFTSNAQKYTLNYLNGYSFLKIYKTILIKYSINALSLVVVLIFINRLKEYRLDQLSRLSWFILGTPLHFHFSVVTVIIGGLILLIFDFGVIYLIGKNQLKSTVNRTIKGDVL